MGVRPWIVLSSSSGETFKALYQGLSENARKQFHGIYFDRDSPGVSLCRSLVGKEKVVLCENKSHLEDEVMRNLKNSDSKEILVFLCGYFCILSSHFISSVGAPVVNTHPSLLPSFAGLDKKVHRSVHETVPVGGFTVHLVTEQLDGGPILFQHPVFLPLKENADEHRARVRAAEQKWLPAALEMLLGSKISAEDRHLSSSLVRNKYYLSIESFAEKEFRQK